jgi:hypothetical protein
MVVTLNKIPIYPLLLLVLPLFFLTSHNRVGAEEVGGANLQGGGSPSLLDLSKHLQMIDGREKFYGLFHFSDAALITYKVSVDHLPDAKTADALDKAWSSIQDPPGINRRAELHAITQRIRQGFQDSFTYKFYISDKPAPKLMVEKVSGNEWDKGYILRIYFADNIITEIAPSSRSVNMWPSSSCRYMDLVNLFPALHSALGVIPDEVQMATIANKPPYFVAHLSHQPVVFNYFVDSNQTLVKEEMTCYPNKKLNVAQFHYSAQSQLWPYQITSDSAMTDGIPQAHQKWDLLGIEKLPNAFDFTPQIPDDYHVQDKTNSN